MYFGLTFVGAGRVNSSVGAASFRWQTGAWTTLTNAAVGVFIGTLGADYGVDVTEMVPLFSVDGALAASQLTTFGIVSGSDVAKTWNVLREGAAGVVSALADVDHWVVFLKRPVRS
jgi:hypothetical protein